MRVGLNLLYFIPGLGGVETFGRELVRALCESAGEETEFVLFTSRDGLELAVHQNRRVKLVICPFHARHRGLRYMWEQCLLPWQVLAQRVDVLHSLAYVGPVLSFVPTILTVHDANTRTVDMNALRRLVLWNVSLWSARTANLVTTVSGFSRGELMKWYGLPDTKIQVVASGPGTWLALDQASDAAALRDLAVQGPYIAAIGGTYPHKNIPRLVEAFLRIANKVQHRLVIIGKIPPDVEEMLHRLEMRRILVTGYLPTEVMRALIARSDLFVMPSLYEGFGFPVLEAQAQGVPVACSNAGSLPEVIHQSAALFDPESVDDMADTLARCITNPELNLELRHRARENAARYSWKNAAAEYLKCYHRIVAACQ